MNRERIERGTPLLLAAMDQYGKRFDRFVPVRVSHATVAMIDDRTLPISPTSFHSGRNFMATPLMQ
jgi:hypothetical protein